MKAKYYDLMGIAKLGFPGKKQEEHNIETSSHVRQAQDASGST